MIVARQGRDERYGDWKNVYGCVRMHLRERIVCSVRPNYMQS